MAKKLSFFEKLTGASWSEKKSAPEESAPEEESEESEEEETVEEKPIKEKPSPIPLKEKIKPISKDMPVEKEKKISLPKKPAEKESEDWLTESEGQLTIDVYQTPNEIVIKSTIAGVKSEDIDITMTNDMITIKGSRQKDEEVKEEDYYYQECYWGAFSRSVILPVDVESDKAKASMKNGILTIRLPKAEKVKTKKIAIYSE